MTLFERIRLSHDAFLSFGTIGFGTLTFVVTSIQYAGRLDRQGVLVLFCLCYLGGAFWAWTMWKLLLRRQIIANRKARGLDDGD